MKLWHKVLLSFGGGILLIYLISNVYVKHLITSKLTEVRKEGYNITWGDFDVDVFLGDIHLTQLEISSNDSSPFEWTANVDKVAIERLNVLDFIFSNQLSGSELKIRSPILSIIERDSLPADFSKKDSTTQKASTLETVLIEHFSIENAQISWSSPERIKGKFSCMEIESLDVSIDSFYIPIADTSLSVSGKYAEIALEKFQSTTKDGKYEFRVAGISRDPETEDLVIRNLELFPLISEEMHVNESIYRKPLVHISVPQISFHHFNLMELVASKNLAASQIKISYPNCILYQDKRLPPDVSKYKQLPQEMLMNAGIGINIDSVKIESGYLKYSENTKESQDRGFIFFEDIDAKFNHVYNRFETDEKIPDLEITIKALFQNKSELAVDFHFPIVDANLSYSFEGSLASMQISNANTILLPVAYVVVEDGWLHSLKFNVIANSYEAVGTMDFDYQDLKVKIMKRKKPKENKMLSLLANNLIINSNNTLRKGDYYRGKIYQIREKNRSFFRHWWKSLQSGFESLIIPNVLLAKELKPEKIKNK